MAPELQESRRTTGKMAGRTGHIRHGHPASIGQTTRECRRTVKKADSAERKGNLVVGDADSCERSRVAGLKVIPGMTSCTVQTGTSPMSAEPTTPGDKPSSGAKRTAAVPWSTRGSVKNSKSPGSWWYRRRSELTSFNSSITARQQANLAPIRPLARCVVYSTGGAVAGTLGAGAGVANFVRPGIGPRKKNRAPMKTYNVGAPMEIVALDVLGPLPESEQGNRHILVIADYFTKWTESHPMPNQEATTVAKLLVEEFVVRFGAPRQLHSDQGRNFESAVFQEMCRLLDIDKTRTTPLRPQSDGMVKRFNRTLEAMLSKFVTVNQKDWDELLPFVMMAYRSSVHESTGCSPSEMMLGRNVQLPVELLFYRPQEEALDSPTEYAHRLQQRMERTHLARDTLRIESDRQKRHYDHRADRGLYDVGDAVWLHNPTRKRGISPKLQRPWEGPYLVTTRIRDVVYRIQRTTKAKPKWSTTIG